jgi:N-acetylmuramoyl-L-alanine amidase
MVILIRRKHLAGFALLILFLCGMSAILWEGRKANIAALAKAGMPGQSTVIIDPGHGGEDGGAVASDGTEESGINLQISRSLNDLMRFCGIRTIMTRTEDVSIYSDGAGTLREKKVSDLKNRVSLVNDTEGAVLLSIHQNCLPSSPGVHGAQVFYNTADGAQQLALAVQNALNESVNVGNAKKSKQISKSIYLMKNVTAPSILVECGFLSNTSETEALKQPAYQKKLAAAIAAGFLSGGDFTEEPT